MKKVAIFAFSALFAIGLASCSKDFDNRTDTANANQALQFSVKNGKGALVTYAIAEGDQWTINTIDVYAFSEGTLIGTGKMNENTDYTFEDSGTTKTITATPAWLSTVTGKTVTFYFVANDALSTSGAHIPTTVPTSEDTFKELLTNKLAGPDVDGKYGLITPVLLFSDVVADVPLTGKVQKDVELIRRDARFDIYNNMSSSIVVNKIYVSNANIQGHIFGTATGTNVPESGSHEAITGPTIYDATTFLATSVFHLYPTTLGKVTDNKTEIVIEATVGGVAQNFVLKGEMDIVANHRYILKLDPVSLTFSVTVADYEEGNGGNPIETELGGDDAFSGFSINTDGVTDSGNWDATNYIYKFDDNDADVLVVTVNSQYGTIAEPKFAIGNESDVTNFDIQKATPVITYGFNVQDVYTIKVPQSDEITPFHLTVTIKSPNGKAKEVITFVKGTLDADAIKQMVEDPRLAEIIAEALAALPPGSTLNDINTIHAGDDNGIFSINGIENLRNLKSITLGASGGKNFNMNLSGILDFSSIPQIETIDVAGCPNVTAINLTNTPNLTYLSVAYTGISSLDVSNNVELTTLIISGTEITEIDFSNIRQLTMLQMTAVPISIIDFDLPNLNTFYFGSNTNANMAPYTTIDLSGMPNLETLNVYGSFGDKLDASTGLSHPNVKYFTNQNCTSNTPDRSIKPSARYELLKTIDVSGLPALETITIRCAPYLSDLIGTESLTNLDKIYLYLDIYSDEIGVQNTKESFNLSSSNSLTDFRFSYSDIKNITLPYLPALTTLFAQYSNYIENLDVTGAPALQTLNVRYSDPVPLFIDITNTAVSTLELRNDNDVPTIRTYKGEKPNKVNQNSLTTVIWE